MAKWHTDIKVVTHIDGEFEANSQEEAWEMAVAAVNTNKVRVWEAYLENCFPDDYDIEYDDDYCPMTFLGPVEEDNNVLIL